MDNKNNYVAEHSLINVYANSGLAMNDRDFITHLSIDDFDEKNVGRLYNIRGFVDYLDNHIRGDVPKEFHDVTSALKKKSYEWQESLEKSLTKQMDLVKAKKLPPEEYLDSFLQFSKLSSGLNFYSTAFNQNKDYISSAITRQRKFFSSQSLGQGFLIGTAAASAVFLAHVYSLTL